MKILFIKNPLEAYPGGGGERHTYELAKYLLKRGHQIWYAGSCPYTEKLLASLKIPIISFGKLGEEATNERAIITYTLRQRFYKKRLLDLLQECRRKYQIEAAYMVSFNEKLLWDKEIAALGIQGVGVEHRLMERQFRLNPFKRLYIANSRNLKLIAVSHAVKERFVRAGLPPDRMRVIHNGIDTRLFIPKKNYQGETVTVGTISRLFPDKGIERLIHGAAYMVPKNHSLKVAIVGDGPERERLQGLIGELQLNDNVKMLGLMDYEQVPAFLAAIDIFTLTPTKGESFGLVLAEAGAAGLPVIANDIGGVHEVIADEETGYIVSALRQDQFNSRLETLVNSAELREKLGRAGRKRVEKMFSLGRMLAEYEKVFLSK